MIPFSTAIPPFSPVHFFGGLPLLRIKKRFCMAADSDLPSFTGFAWRGLLGHELQRLICPFNRRPLCAQCLIRQSCPYALLFEEENTSAALAEAPRGYLLDPPLGRELSRNPSKEQALTLTLVGESSRFLPVVIMSMIEGQRTGLGYKRNPYVLTGIEEMFPDGSSVSVPVNQDLHGVTANPTALKDWLLADSEPAAKAVICFKTPVRLRKQGKYFHQPDWPFFFESLARKLESLLCLFSEGQPVGKEPWLALKDHFHQYRNIHGHFRWWDLHRYSGKQKKKIPMGGIIGEAILKNPSPGTMHWFKAAELLHVGKGAAMGMGKVNVATLNHNPQET